MSESLTQSHISEIDEFILLDLSNENRTQVREEVPTLCEESKASSEALVTVIFRCHGEPMEILVDMGRARRESWGHVAEFAAVFDEKRGPIVCQTDWSRKALEVVVDKWAYGSGPWTLDEETSFELLTLAAIGGRGDDSNINPLWSSLSAAAQNDLFGNLTIHNCIDYCDKAIERRALFLKFACLGFIERNFSQVAQDLHLLSTSSRLVYDKWEKEILAAKKSGRQYSVKLRPD
ncbi:hypothetical protein HDE_08269 [Halotydeus destructor]|nr:hypothetical protein HDE_08269 [Halotydeus destructor]